LPASALSCRTRMSVPTPVWSRPDDAVRQAQLDAMKRRATGLLALAAAVFGAAAALETRYPWLGYVRATAEASLVGGLADWFAVTALFRRPLGLPIPHTAIVATRKERIGRILGNFVQSHFLSRDVIRRQVRAESPWWVPGAVDDKIYEKIVGAIELLLRRIATDPGHPLRVAFDAALRDFIDRLQHSPDAIARTEALKEDWLAEPGAAE